MKKYLSYHIKLKQKAGISMCALCVKNGVEKQRLPAQRP